MNTHKNISNVIVIVLVALWVYTAMVKLGNMEYNLDTMRKQLFTMGVANVLAYLVPIAALGTAGLLMYRVRWGLWASVVLLSSFSIYIIVFLSEIFVRQTCSCAGIFYGMGYVGHLVFNIAMLLITSIGLFIHYKKINGVAENREQSRHLNTIL